MTTRFDHGFTNANRNSDLHQSKFILPDPTKAHIYFEDFDYYTAADWTVTETQASATQALANVDGGVLLLTNSAADDDLNAMQKVGESFKFESNKRLWFKARFAVSDATQSDFVMGLQITDNTPLDVTDGVFFYKVDGETGLRIRAEKDNTGSEATSIATIANNTYIVVAFYYNGTDAIEYYIDDVYKGALAVTNLPDDEELTISFGIQNGEAVAKTMSIDYIMAAKER